jgi:hypothetical protein
MGSVRYIPFGCFVADGGATRGAVRRACELGAAARRWSEAERLADVTLPPRVVTAGNMMRFP